MTSRRPGSARPPLDLGALIGTARGRVPASHRALLEQIGVQDAVVGNWPSGVQALYQTLRETPPAAGEIAGAVAVWLPGLRVVAFNGPVLAHALRDPELTESTRQAMIDTIAWHEYGHALSVALASSAMKSAGPRLAELLPPGLRRLIDYPGAYRARQVFDEVIANVYALMVGRAVHHNDYGVPDFLDAEIYDAFQSVVPWPPHRE